MTSSFKEMVAKDIHDVFLNLDEFSEIHNINGKDMPCQVDTYEQIEREKRYKDHMDGVYVGEKLIYVAASDFGKIPKQNSILELDGRVYRVTEAVEEDIGGIYSITIGANKS